MLMTETAEDYELFHYGVKGMKWGVRKDRKELASNVKKVAKKNLKASAWTNQEEGKARAQKLLERHNGSKVKAIGHSLAANAGRAAATAVLSVPLALTPAGLVSIPVATGVAVGTTGRHMQDVYNIARSK